MLNRIVSFSLRHRGVIISLAVVALIYGIYSVQVAKYDVFPEFAPPQVTIETECPGLSPEQVELLVTRPIESAINGVPGVDALRSGSIQGVSIINVVFKQATDVYRDRQVVAERLAAIGSQLPAGIGLPIITPLTTSTSVVQAIGLTSDSLSLMDLRTVADWTIKQRLLAVPGVAKIAVYGGEVKELQVQINPRKLMRYGISTDEIVPVVRKATGIRGAGFIENENQRITIQTNGQSITPLELSGVLVKQAGNFPVTLGDVADVSYAPAPQIGSALVMGKRGIILMVSSQYGANTLEVSRRIEEALKELKPTLNAERIKIYPQIFQASNFIQTAIQNVKNSLWVGATLVIAVLLLFLFNLRTAAISLLAIPLSLLTAVTVLGYLGVGLNTMSMGGLAIAIGEVVDDAVIDVENILRRLRENRLLAIQRPVLEVILDASIEVRGAVVYATFAVVLVFVPVITMGGVAGRLFSPLAYAYILSVLASLLVALTLTPALSIILLGKGYLRVVDSPLVLQIKKYYRYVLYRIENHWQIVVTVIAILTIGGLFLIPFMRGTFLPELKEGHFIAHATFVPGTSLSESERIEKSISNALLKIPYVRTVGVRIGRAELGDDIMGTQSAEIEIGLKKLSADQSDLALNIIRDTLSHYVGATMSINTFLTERVNETLSGYTSPVVVNVYGNDLDVLNKKAREIASILEKVKGASSVQVQSPPGMPQLTVNLRKDALLQWGFEPVDILDAIRTAYQGDIVGQIYDGNEMFNVDVILSPRYRNMPDEVGNLLIKNRNGVYIPLRQIANIYETTGSYVVLHDGARRVQTVTCNVNGKGVEEFMSEARRKIDREVVLPPGTYVTYSGSAQESARSKQDLILHSAVAAIGILIMLSLVTKSWRNLVLIVANLPFALVGGVLATMVSGGDFSVGSLVGFVTVFGITLRNSIMMISHYDHLVNFEGAVWGLDTAVRGASERLTPILMTASVTAFGLLPLALGSGAPGREIEGPMAIIILGGLFTSTLLNLIVLPTLALKFGHFKH
ncbi:MAG: efflux RND transporter permease subunit [Candidatus Kryptoniota bacterium]